MKEMITNMRALRSIGAAALLVAGIGFGGHLEAQEAPSPILVVIDKDSIEFGVQQYQVPPDALNDLIASVGVRDPLPFFAANVGAQFLLRTGLNGSDSWFGFTRAPIQWESGAGADDALENFVLAGPGLGSPDSSGQRASLLSSVDDMVPVRSDRAALLVGRSVCAVVYDTDLAIAENDSRVNLDGPNLGMVAFRVSSIFTAGSAWPTLLVEALDVRSTCGEKVDVF